MTEWQIRKHALLRPVITCMQVELDISTALEPEGIVGNHDRFRISSGTTRVDQQGAMARFRT